MTDILVSKGYIITNKYILNKYGIDASILIGELCGEYAYWFKNKKLKNDYFYSTRYNIFKNTGLTKYKQRNKRHCLSGFKQHVSLAGYAKMAVFYLSDY